MHALSLLCTRCTYLRQPSTLFSRCRAPFLPLGDVAPPPKKPFHWLTGISGRRGRPWVSSILFSQPYLPVYPILPEQHKYPSLERLTTARAFFAQSLKSALSWRFGNLDRLDAPSVMIVSASQINTVLEGDVSIRMKRLCPPATSVREVP